MKKYANLFVPRHAAEHFSKLMTDPTAKMYEVGLREVKP